MISTSVPVETSQITNVVVEITVPEAEAPPPPKKKIGLDDRDRRPKPASSHTALMIIHVFEDKEVETHLTASLTGKCLSQLIFINNCTIAKRYTLWKPTRFNVSIE